jgi:hypothetical protein
MAREGRDGRGEDRDVPRADARQERLHGSAGGVGERGSEEDAGGGENGALAEDHPQDRSGLRAERHADADLTGALGDREREEPVDPDAGEEKREKRKGSQDAELDLPGRRIGVDDLGEHPDLGDGQLRIGLRDGGADAWQQVSGLRRDPDNQVLGDEPMIERSSTCTGRR